MADDEDGFILPTDAFVEVLLRLPTSARRRFRLVCKRWRDVVDERTPERQVRTKTLAFLSQGRDFRALVLDADDGPREWTFQSSNLEEGAVRLVGTCNGLLCLRDHAPPVGYRYGTALSTISVVNPVTGETLVLPRKPAPLGCHEEVGMYSFGYHPTTGEYKVVDVSRRFTWPDRGPRKTTATVRVITLGRGAAWREVPVPGWSYGDACGVVTVDGSTCWLTARADRVVALDHASERVASFETPPPLRLLQVPEKAACHLTSVHARLGAVVTRPLAAEKRVDVWVLEGSAGAGGRRQPRWSRRYSLLQPSSGPADVRWITAPHFTYGEYVLSGRETRWETALFRREVGELTSAGAMDAPPPRRPLEGAKLIMCKAFDGYATVVAFPYVETTEPVPGGARQ